MRNLCVILLLVAGMPAVAQAQQPRMVDVQRKVGDEWKAYPTRLLDDLPKSISPQPDSALISTAACRHGRRRPRASSIRPKSMDVGGS